MIPGGDFQEVQGLLIDKIKSTFPSNLSLSDELSDLLQVSSDSAYRRIRCETAFTINEIYKICNHFNISFDSLTSVESGIVTFNYEKVESVKDMIRYLESIKKDMSRILRSPDKHITYTAVDLPVFHYFKFPEYFQFKMFYWLRSVSAVSEFQEMKFSIKEINPDIKRLCLEIADLYAQIPSTEIWTDGILDSVIKQIQYYWQLGEFESLEDALSLIETIKKTLCVVEHQSEMNMKLMVNGQSDNFSQNFKLYQSDIDIGNNYILVSIGALKILYQSFHTFNKMFTTSYEYCNQTQNWMNNQLKQANLISGVGEKYRVTFFRRLYDRLADLAWTLKKS